MLAMCTRSYIPTHRTAPHRTQVLDTEAQIHLTWAEFFFPKVNRHQHTHTQPHMRMRIRILIRIRTRARARACVPTTKETNTPTHTWLEFDLYMHTPTSCTLCQEKYLATIRNLVIGVGFWQQATGSEAVLYYASTFLENAGLKSTNSLCVCLWILLS